MSDFVRPHRWQPSRLPRPWDSPGRSTGVGCHFLLQYMRVKSESEVAQSYLTLSDPMDCSLSGSSAHGIFQVRVLQWDAIAFSSTIAWKIPWTEELGRLQSMGSQRVRHDWATSLSLSLSSPFSKSSLNIWKFMVHVLLKPGLENFEHYLLVCEMSVIAW